MIQDFTETCLTQESANVIGESKNILYFSPTIITMKKKQKSAYFFITEKSYPTILQSCRCDYLSAEKFAFVQVVFTLKKMAKYLLVGFPFLECVWEQLRSKKIKGKNRFLVYQSL